MGLDANGIGNTTIPEAGALIKSMNPALPSITINVSPVIILQSYEDYQLVSSEDK